MCLQVLHSIMVLLIVYGFEFGYNDVEGSLKRIDTRRIDPKLIETDNVQIILREICVAIVCSLL